MYWFATATVNTRTVLCKVMQVAYYWAFDAFNFKEGDIPVHYDMIYLLTANG